MLIIDVLNEYNEINAMVDAKYAADHPLEFDPMASDPTKPFFLMGSPGHPPHYYSEADVMAMVRGLKNVVAGLKPKFACNPNPYGGVFK